MRLGEVLSAMIPIFKPLDHFVKITRLWIIAKIFIGFTHTEIVCDPCFVYLYNYVCGDKEENQYPHDLMLVVAT